MTPVSRAALADAADARRAARRARSRGDLVEVRARASAYAVDDLGDELARLLGRDVAVGLGVEQRRGARRRRATSASSGAPSKASERALLGELRAAPRPRDA